MALRYWVATSGGNWNSTSSWSSVSGGASGSSVPTQFDDVIFDANSITSANRQITIDVTANCASFLATNVANSPKVKLNFDLNVYGSFVVPSTMFFYAPAVAGELFLLGSGGECNISTGGTLYRGVHITVNADANYKLLSNLKTDRSFTVMSGGSTGDFNLNGYSLDCSFFTSSGGTGELTANGTLNVENTFSVTTDDADFSESVINLKSVTTTSTFNGNGLTFNEVNLITSGSGTMSFSDDNTVINNLTVRSSSDDITFDGTYNIGNLTQENSSNISFEVAGSSVETWVLGNSAVATANANIYIKDITVNSSSELSWLASGVLWVESITSNASSASKAVLKSATAGSIAYIKIPKGVIEVSNLSITDVGNITGNSFYASNSTDNGGNAGIIFGSKPTYTDDKQIVYKIYSGIGGVALGELDNVTNSFGFSNEVNTAGGSFNLDINDVPVVAIDNSLYEVDNHLEVWIKDNEAPAGTKVFQGYLSSVDYDFENEKIKIKVLGYGSKLEKLLVLTPDTEDYSYSGSFTSTIGATTNPLLAYTSNNGFLIEPITTGVGITNISAVSYKIGTLTGYSGQSRVRVKIFSSQSSAENIVDDLSLGTSSWVVINNIAITDIVLRFDTPITVSASTTYYARLELEAIGDEEIVSINYNLSSTSGARAKSYSNASFSNRNLSNIKVYTNADDTSITYSSTDISDIFKAVVDSFVAQGGNLIYTPFSIDTTGVTITHTFNTDKIIDALNTCQKAAPKGWVWYVDNATNVVYFKQERDTETVDLYLPRGEGLASVKMTKDLDSIVNTVYFTGGDTGGGNNLFIKYLNTDSFNTYGRIAVGLNDSRVTNSSTASAMSNAVLDRYAEPIINITCELLDSNKGGGVGGFDIENVYLGQNVVITGFDSSVLWDSAVIGVDSWDSKLNALSAQVMQIVRIDYKLDKIKLTLNTPVLSIFTNIRDNKRDIEVVQTINNPTAPS